MIRQTGMNVKQKMKVAISGAENRFKSYFSPKGADVYTRFVRRMFLFLALAVIAAAIILSVVVFIARVGAPLTKVPNVINLDIVNASILMQEKKLIVELDSKFDERYEKFQVIDQFPKKGLTVRQGRTVKLIVSMGKDVYVVPQLEGLNRLDAEKLLREKGIPYLITVIQVEDTPTNTIVAQDIKAGKEVPRSVKLQLTANSDVGKNDYRVEQFVGQSLDFAITTLYNNGITVKLEKMITDNADLDGLVQEQDYEEGTVIPKNSTIKIKVGVYGEDDYEKGKYDYHIYKKFITRKTGPEGEEMQGDGQAIVSIVDELGEEREVYNLGQQYNKTVIVTFKSFGTTKLTLVVDNFLRDEVTYD